MALNPLNSSNLKQLAVKGLKLVLRSALIGDFLQDARLKRIMAYLDGCRNADNDVLMYANVC